MAYSCTLPLKDFNESCSSWYDSILEFYRKWLLVKTPVFLCMGVALRRHSVQKPVLAAMQNFLSLLTYTCTYFLLVSKEISLIQLSFCLNSQNTLLLLLLNSTSIIFKIFFLNLDLLNSPVFKTKSQWRYIYSSFCLKLIVK